MRKKEIYFLFHFIIFLCLMPFGLKAQKIVLPAHQLTTADNLTSQTYNYFVLKDSKGFVWISSDNGLNCYDGQEVIPFHSNNTDSTALLGESIQGRLYEDKYTNIWFGTIKGVSCYDRKLNQFRNYQIKRNDVFLKDYKLLFINEKKTTIWLAAAEENLLDKIYRFSVDQPDSMSFVTTYKLTNNTRIIEEVGEDFLTAYVPVTKGLGLGKLLLSKNKPMESVAKADTLLRAEDIVTLIYENEKTIWCLAPDGLHKMDASGKCEVSVNNFKGKALKSMNSLDFYGDSMLLIGTRNEGVYLFDKNNYVFTDEVDIAKDGKLQAFRSKVEFIYTDNDGTIWISTDGQGVFYMTPAHQKMKAYLQNYEGDLLGDSNIKSIAEDDEGNLWCLTKGEGLIVTDAHGMRIPEYRELSKNVPEWLKGYTYSIFIGLNNQVFVCSYEGLFVLSKESKPMSYKRVDLDDASESDGAVWGMTCANNNVLVSGLVGFSGNQGVSLCRLIEAEKGFELKPIKFEQPLDDFTKMIEDSNGAIYLTVESEGLAIGHLNENQFRLDTFLTMAAIVKDLLEDVKNDCLWLATSRGLYQLKRNNGTYSLIENKVFEKNNLTGILSDNSAGFLWISSSQGLYAFHPDSSYYRRFHLAEGLQSQEYNLWAALKTNSGLLAFGGTNGINLFDPKEALKQTAEVPVPQITRINIDGEPDSSLVCHKTAAKNVSEFKSLRLPFKKNTISFSFAAMDYRDPSANKFQYKMKDVDDDWVNANDNSARYPNLAIGDYTFYVRASSAEGVWSKDPDFITELKITILAPWYRTWLAYFTYVVLFVGAILRSIQKRIRKIRKEAEQKRREAEHKRKEAEFKQKEAEFKQKEAEYKQLAAETETAVLRLQMNPHFIFNSMNSISSYILERDVDTANTYLDRFAKLMRMILKLGKQPLIPVADEMDLLEQYMKTEAMRFERKFDYDFDLGSGIDEDDTLVPTMILQPFVENAIWHGLSGKKEKGHIQIRFWKEATTIYCSIEDNGVGREAARKKKKITAHKSQALEITRRRLDLLGEKEGQKSDFIFEDILDESGQVAGTRVVLRLPIL